MYYQYLQKVRNNCLPARAHIHTPAMITYFTHMQTIHCINVTCGSFIKFGSRMFEYLDCIVSHNQRSVKSQTLKIRPLLSSASMRVAAVMVFGVISTVALWWYLPFISSELVDWLSNEKRFHSKCIDNLYYVSKYARFGLEPVSGTSTNRSRRERYSLY